MFTLRQTQNISKEYFNIINVSAYSVTIQSKNTSHYWHIVSQDYSIFNSCIIYHKHNYSDPYHHHGRAGSLSKAIRKIKQHDTFQLNGRNNNK